MDTSKFVCSLAADDVDGLTDEILKKNWEGIWGLTAPPKISKKMLRKSLLYKLRERDGLGLSIDEQVRLKRLLEKFRKNKLPESKSEEIKRGTRLIRTWQGKKYSVLVTDCGFEYDGKEYGSLSKIANLITGTKWNGRVFFGLKTIGSKK